MPSERVTLTVRSNIGEEGPLTVEDAMRQILDFFEVLVDAQEEEENGRSVSWQLVNISMQSPLEASAEPFAFDPAIATEIIARRAKNRVVHAFNEITTTGRVPSWVKPSTREKVRRILKRNTNGIGRTDIKISDSEPIVAIVEKSARAGLLTLDRSDLETAAAQEDFSRTEIGSIEGDVIQTTTYHKKPALVIRDRVSGHDVVCVLSSDLADAVGPHHRWDEVWHSRRVLIGGELFYRPDGQVARIGATEFATIEPMELTSVEITDKNFTGGLSPVKYLEKIREGGRG